MGYSGPSLPPCGPTSSFLPSGLSNLDLSCPSLTLRRQSHAQETLNSKASQPSLPQVGHTSEVSALYLELE